MERERKKEDIKPTGQAKVILIMDHEIVQANFFFNSVIFPFLWVSSPFDSLDWGLTLVRGTASYSNEGLAAVTIYHKRHMSLFEEREIVSNFGRSIS